MKRGLWISGLVLSLIVLSTAAGIVFLVKTDNESRARLQEPIRRVAVEVYRIAPRNYTRWVEAYATVRPFRKGTISAQVMGRIVRLAPGTDPGMEVKEGQELAKIEDTRYRLNLRKAEAAVRKLEALLEIERNENERRATTYRIAKQRLELARAELERNQELFEKELIAKQTLERAQNHVELLRSEFERARSELQSRKARIRSIQADLAAAKAEIDRIRVDLADTVVTAPFDGVIGERYVEIGDQVTVGQKLFTVLDISSVKVIARIPSEFVGRIEVGIPVEVSSRAQAGASFHGTVSHVYPEGDPKNRTFAVEITVVNRKKPMILPGMFAQVRVPVMVLDQALLVPRDALMQDEKGTYLYVVDPSKQTAQRRTLVVGDLTPEEALVIEGLNPGELIVIRGQERLHNGASVRWVSPPPAAAPARGSS